MSLPSNCIPRPAWSVPLIESIVPETAAHSPARIMDPTVSPEWDSLVRAHPDGTFFHHSAWAKVLRDSYNFQPLYLAHESGSALCLLPLMEVRSPLTGIRAVSLPFSDSCDALMTSDCEPGEEFLAELLNLGNSRQWRYIDFHGGRNLWPRATPSTDYFCHELDLSLSEPQLWDGLDSSTRRAVRRARSAGVCVRTGRLLEDVRAFYSLHCQTRRKHGLPPQPFRFFERLHAHVIAEGLGTVFLAYHLGAVVAAAVFVHVGQHVTYKFGASSEQDLTVRPNNLLMWEALCHFRAAGSHRLSFGRTAKENPGLRRFKLGWGAHESIAEYFRFDVKKRVFTTTHERTVGWHNQIFRRLPLSAARVCGQLLYRHMA